jgi:cytochrome c oxidase cbb3-type subunit 3
MFRSVLESINGVNIYPVISLVIFFIFFVVILFRTFRMSELPLEKEDSSDKNFKGDKNV